MEITKFNNQFLPSFFGGLSDDFFGSRTPSKFSEVAVNILDKEGNFIIEMAIPGINKKDVNIEIDGNKLSISAEKEMKTETEEENYTLREFTYGTFRRSFTLPKDVNVQNIEADYVDGILIVTIPKPEVQKKLVKKIEIK